MQTIYDTSVFVLIGLKALSDRRKVSRRGGDVKSLIAVQGLRYYGFVSETPCVLKFLKWGVL